MKGIVDRYPGRQGISLGERGAGKITDVEVDCSGGVRDCRRKHERTQQFTQK
jgi:hypothetical protein